MSQSVDQHGSLTYENFPHTLRQVNALVDQLAKPDGDLERAEYIVRDIELLATQVREKLDAARAMFDTPASAHDETNGFPAGWAL